MLSAAPREQLEAVISQTSVPEEHRRVFLGKAAAAMLVVLGAAAAATALSLGVRPGQRPPTKGVEPDRPPQRPDRVEPSHGDRPPPPMPKESPELNHPSDKSESKEGK